MDIYSTYNSALMLASFL